MKTIVATFVLTVTALAVASASYIYNHGLRATPAQVIQVAGVPPPCGLPGLPPCPPKPPKPHKKAKTTQVSLIAAR